MTEMTERKWDPTAQTMFEIVGGDDNVCYWYDFVGNSKEPDKAFIIVRGGGDFTVSDKMYGFFFNQHGKWWYIDRERGGKVPQLRQAREGEEESIVVLLTFLKGTISVAS